VGTNPENCLILDFHASLSILISEVQPDSYSGPLICTICGFPPSDQGFFSFSISDNIISNFLFDQNIECYIFDVISSDCVNCTDTCLGIYTGQGIIEDEITLNIDFAGVDCRASSEATLSLIRQ